MTDTACIKRSRSVPRPGAVLATGRVVVGRVAITNATVVEQCAAPIDAITIALAGWDTRLSPNAFAAVVEKCPSTRCTIAVAGEGVCGTADADIAGIEVGSSPEGIGAIDRARSSASRTTDAPLTTIDKCTSSLDQSAITGLNPSRSFDACAAEVAVGGSIGHACAICAGASVAPAHVADIEDRTAAPDSVAVPLTAGVVIEWVVVTHATAIQRAGTSPDAIAVLAAGRVVVGSVRIANPAVVERIWTVRHARAIDGALETRWKHGVVV